MKKITEYFIVFILMPIFSCNFSGNHKGHKASDYQEFKRFEANCQNYFDVGADEIDIGSMNKLIELSYKLEDDSLKAIAFNWIGNYYLYTFTDYDKATEYLYKAIPLARKSNDKRRISSLYFDLAYLYYYKRELDLVLINADEGYKCMPSQNDSKYLFLERQYFNLLAVYHSRKGNLDSSLIYWNRLKEVNLKDKSEYWEVVYYGGIAKYYSFSKEFGAGNDFYQKALNLAYGKKNKFQFSHYSNSFSRSLLEQNLIKESKQVALAGYRYSNSNKLLKEGLESAKTLSKIYGSLNLKDSAIFFYKVAEIFRDSIEGREKGGHNFSLALNDKQNRFQDQVRREEIKHERGVTIKLMGISIFIVIILLFYFIYSNSFFAKKFIQRNFGLLIIAVIFEFINLLIHVFIGGITNHDPILMLIVLIIISGFAIKGHHYLENSILPRIIEKQEKVRQKRILKLIEISRKFEQNEKH